MIESMDADAPTAAFPIEGTIRQLLEDTPASLVAALEGRGHTPDELEAYARSSSGAEQQETLRQLMLKAASSPAPEDARLAAHLQGLLDPRERAWQRVIQAHERGETLTAMVTEAVKGGLVVDLGVRGFIPASHAGLAQNVNLQALVGRTLPLRVIEINRRRQVVVLSHRSVLEEQRARRRRETLQALKVGDVREGSVRRLSDIGAFVDVGGVDGLLHVSEIAWKPVNHPSDALKVGQKVQVLVQRVEPENGRVSLSIRRLTIDPWAEVRKRFAVGKSVKARVTELNSGGAVVELEGGQDAFIPMRELSAGRIRRPEEAVQVGQELEALVIEARDRDRRLILSLREAHEQRERREVQSYSRKQRDDGRTTLGDLFGHLFADQLREAHEMREARGEPEPVDPAGGELAAVESAAPAGGMITSPDAVSEAEPEEPEVVSSAAPIAGEGQASAESAAPEATVAEAIPATAPEAEAASETMAPPDGETPAAGSRDMAA